MVHATEILDNAFAAALCAKTEGEAGTYLSQIYHPLTKLTANNVDEDDWEEAAEQGKLTPGKSRPAFIKSLNL